MPMFRAAAWFLGLSILAVAIIEGMAWLARHPQDFPWTELRLDQPTGKFTAPKLAALGGDAGRCRALLLEAGTSDVAVPPRAASPVCGYDDGLRLSAGGARELAFLPSGPVTACPVAAGLLLWEQRVVGPAAQRHLGVAVSAVLHAGSYSCRRLYNRDDGAWSEHATADAFDVLGFRLANGRTISVLRDWEGRTPQARFLKDVRDGACGLFPTVLSPDYNEAHRDHFHLDMSRRGWRICR